MLFKVGAVVVVLLVAFLVSRSCGRVGNEISQDQAVEIAKGQLDFEPDQFQVRLFKKGVNSRPYWGVSLYNGPRTQPTRCRVVQVDAVTGRVAAVSRCA
ncbi:MAG: hypothetical protein WD027_02255 [Gaiellales bacterium]